MDTYLFVAYKPDSADYCMGCHMASYSSDFEIHNNLTREELLTMLAKYTLKNQDLRINEAGYGIYIYKNGHRLIEEGSVSLDLFEKYYWRDEDYPDNIYDLEAKYTSEAHAILNECVKPLEEMKKKKIDEIKANELKKQQELREAEENRQRKQYEELKKKYGDSNI